jgi:opacity protein-like surface antigen
MMKSLLLAASLFAATAAAAAPQQMNLVYDLYRNGQKLGQVTDTFTRSGNRYTLVSETRAKGPLKILWPGTIRLESTGNVTRQGLRPEQFQHARSDAPHKLATARLDWKQRSIAYEYKGESWRVNGLQAGAQDQLSQLYQFVFAPRLPADYSVQVVSGRDLNDYRYANSDGGTLQTPLGALATRQYQRITQKPDEKGITVWVAPARHNLPVQVRVIEDGVTLEQRLVSASVKG